jgi:hypothetical protein
LFADLAFSFAISVSPPELATLMSSVNSTPSFPTFEEALTYVSAIIKFLYL